MANMIVKQMPTFRKAYKKLHVKQQFVVNEAIQVIIDHPELGQEKKGDLSGVFVYKFKIQRQLMLFAYEWDPTQRILLALGVHENFHRDLKS
jgi:hypothetical protein